MGTPSQVLFARPLEDVLHGKGHKRVPADRGPASGDETEDELPDKGPLNGLWPLVLAGVLLSLSLRSCIGGFGLPFLGGSSGSGSGASENAGASGAASPGAVTTVDPVDELWEMMDPIEPVCPAEDGSTGRHLQWTEPPPMCIDPAKSYVATLHTNRGDIVIELDTENAPVTVNNFVFLARWFYYDGVEFFDVIPEWFLGAGDPFGRPRGLGSPGYRIQDEPPAKEPYYPLYSVIMAKGPDVPDSDGSIFLILTGWESTWNRDPHYTRLGQVIEGRGVLHAIEATAGRANTGDVGTPREPTTINGITITER